MYGVIDRKKYLPPSEAPEPECRDTDSHGEDDKTPPALLQPVDKIRPFHPLEREIEQDGRHCERHGIFQYLFIPVFHIPVP